MAPFNAAFLDELRVFGFVDGKNLKVDDSGFGLRDEQIAEIVTAMAKSPPDVIHCAAVAHIRAAQEAMPAVPISGLALIGKSIKLGTVEYKKARRARSRDRRYYLGVVWC